MPESDLVKTGIKGLDEILFGGIPRGVILLRGGPAATGKTTLGGAFVYRGARQFNEPGVIVLFEVAPDKLIRDAALFGWDLRELERDGRLKMVFTTRQVFQQELLQADSVLLAEAAEIGARRIFVDGLVRLAEPNGGEPREAFHLLAEGLHRENMTAMLALESTMVGPAAARAPEEFGADTIIQPTIEPVQRAVLRSVEVVKSRGHEYALERTSVRIVNGQGLEVYRRVQAPRSLQREGSAAFDTTSRVATGIPGLDELVNGGYFVASTTLVVGISGAGKSVMALQFIAEGARRRRAQPHDHPGRAAGPGPSQRPEHRDRPAVAHRYAVGPSVVRAATRVRDRPPFRPDRGDRRGLQAPARGDRQPVDLRVEPGRHRAQFSRLLPRHRGADEGAPGHRSLQPREPRNARHVVDDGRIQGQLARGQHHLDELGRAGRYLPARAHGGQDAGNADEPNDPRVRGRERPGHEGAPAAARCRGPLGALRRLPRTQLSRARTACPEGGPRSLLARFFDHGAQRNGLRARRGMDAGPREVRGRDPPGRRALRPRRAPDPWAGASNSPVRASGAGSSHAEHVRGMRSTLPDPDGRGVPDRRRAAAPLRGHRELARAQRRGGRGGRRRVCLDGLPR